MPWFCWPRGTDREVEGVEIHTLCRFSKYPFAKTAAVIGKWKWLNGVGCDLPAFGWKLLPCSYIIASLPTLGISIFAIYSLFPPLNSSIMATVNMDSVQFYQPPFMTPLFSRKYSTSLHIDHEPPAAPRYKGSQVLESFGVPALDGWGDFRLQHNSGWLLIVDNNRSLSLYLWNLYL